MKHAGAVLKADICENTVQSNRACSVVNQERLFGSGSSHRNHSHEPWHSFSWKHHFWLQTSSSRPSASFEGTLSLVCLTLAQATSLSRHFFLLVYFLFTPAKRSNQACLRFLTTGEIFPATVAQCLLGISRVVFDCAKALRMGFRNSSWLTDWYLCLPVVHRNINFSHSEW